MTNVQLERFSTRLHPALVQQIRRDAKRARRSEAEYVRLVLEDSLSFDPSVSNSVDNARDSDVIQLTED